VDDEPAWLKSLSLTLRSCAGLTNLTTCQESTKVMGLLEQKRFGVVILDLTMPHVSGEELLKQIGESHPYITTIVISGLNQLETAVRCMKLGAFDYFIKTDEEERIVGGILRAVRMVEMQRNYQEMSHHLRSGDLRHPEAFAAIVTADRGMLALFAYAEAVANSPQPLLITGESGVGKELIARAVHKLSGCKGKLVTVNVAGLDDTVFADTLFGHLRGAFTGADHLRKGIVEEASDGTLFLDEIGDLSIPSQVKLLRLLQEGEYYPLGSDQPKRIKARVIVATHQICLPGSGRNVSPRPLLPAANPPCATAAGSAPATSPAPRPFSRRSGPRPRKKRPTPPGVGGTARHLQFAGNVRGSSDGLRCRQRPS
jgi:DNA-binding NtrC family response regulator